MRLIVLMFTLLGVISSINAKENSLGFKTQNFTIKFLKMPDGEEVSYKVYEEIFYVTNAELSNKH